MARKAAERERESVLLRLLYETVPGRMLLKVGVDDKRLYQEKSYKNVGLSPGRL